MTTNINSVKEYIASFDEHIKNKLEAIRSIILEAHPDIKESIAYGMPAYKLNKKPLVYFAGYAKHVGFYATPTGHHMFREVLSEYKQGKGSVQFPHDHPLPIYLIEKIVNFRVDECLQKL